MMKFRINNRTDRRKSDINLLNELDVQQLFGKNTQCKTRAKSPNIIWERSLTIGGGGRAGKFWGRALFFGVPI